MTRLAIFISNVSTSCQVLRRPADHQPRHEYRDDGEHQHAVQPAAHAAKDDLAQLDHPQRHQATQRRVRIVHAVDAAVGCRRRGSGQIAELAIPKRTSLPSMLPPGCNSDDDWSTPSLASSGLPCDSDQTQTPSIGTKITSMASRIASLAAYRPPSCRTCSTGRPGSEGSPASPGSSTVASGSPGDASC